MSQSIELQVSLGLQQAESQASKLRELLKSSVKIDTSAFKSLNNALTGAEKQIAQLKSQMNSAFQTAGGSKKFLHDYDKLFESLSAIGSRFDFLKEADIIFSPESSAELKNMRSELEQLDGKIKQIKAGKIGNLFDDSSVDSIKEVQEVAESMKVTLSKTTFSEFGQKLAGKMAETKTQIEDLRKQAELLDQAVNNTSLSKNSIFSQMSMEKLMGNTSEVIDKDSARTLREKISSLYEQYGLTDVELGKTIKAGSNIDQIFVAEEERVRQSSDKYVKVLEEQKQKIQDELNKFDEGLKQSGGDGKRANWETKLAYIDEIKQKFSGLLTFSEVPASVRKDGTGITKYVEQFKQELAEGIKNLNVSDITKELQEKVRNIINGASTKSVITDASTFKTQVETILKDSFGGLDLKGVTDEIKNGMNIEDAIDRILVNVKNKIQSNGGAKALNDEADKLQAAYDKMARVGSTVKGVEASENAALKENEAAFASLTQKVLDYVAAKLGLTSSQVAQILNDESGAIDKGRTALEQYIESLNKLEGKQKTLSSVQSAVTRWMGFYQVLNLTKKAVNDMKQHIQELDTVMTQIAVVTNMSQEQLWGQIGKYSEIARSYGVAIKGVYEVSQIYYQQGLESNDVMTLTTETLKMARIAGLDYSTAADYMTTAIRGFKLEMTDAAHVTDVFSALAASTASSTEELAVAISKTAASAANVGSSFEATSAMMATMIATTRESATNIGTALKSIISRYGEMTSKPNATTDSEGEEMSLNRVDKALQTIGITLHTTTGEFRNFDEVIVELAEKWDTLDSVSQRYIATIMAGNRQQSRFLALVSNVDEYKRALEVAQGSEGSGELQMLKTLDSVDAKLEKMRVTIQEFYTSSGLEQLYKNIIDTITNIISAANSLPKAFGKIPVQALAIGMSLVSVIKNVVTLILSSISSSIELMKHNTSSALEGMVSVFAEKGRKMGEAVKRGMEEGSAGAGTTIGNQLSKGLGLALQYIGAGLSAWGATKTISGISAYGASTTSRQDQLAGQQTGTGGILGILGSAATGAAAGTMINPGVGTAIGAAAGVLKGVIENIATLKSASDMYNVTLAREIELSQKRLEAAKTEEEKAKGEEKTLVQAYDKLIELQKHQYDSVEAMQEYTDYMNQLGESYPKFIESIGTNGDVLINVTSLENALADARKNTADATLAAAKAELEGANLNKTAYEELQQNVNGLRGFDIQELRFASGSALKYAQKGYDQYGQLIAAYNERYGASLPIDQRWGQGETNNYNTIFAHQEEFMNYWNDLAAEGNETILNYQRSQLKSMIDTFDTQHQDLNIAKQLGFDNNEVLIASIQSYSDLIKVLDNIDAIASQYIDNASEIVENAEEAISRAEISQAVQNSITKLQKSDNTKEREQGKQLQDYTSFLDFLFDTIPTEGELQHAEQLVLDNSQDAERLKNVDYSLLRGFEDLDLGAFEEYSKQFYDDYYDYVTQLHSGFTTQLLDFGDSLDRTIFQKLAYGGENGGIINKLFPVMRESLSKYSSLLEDGLPALAENYRYGLEKFYSQIGELTLEQQTNIASLVPNIDFTDADSLISAAETLSEMGPEYTDLATILTTAAKRFVGNAQLILTQVAEAASDTAKAIETAIDNQGKTFKRSEALKNAQELLSNYTGEEEFDWTDLYTYDKELGGYFENENAFMVRMVNARAEAQKQVENAQRAIDLESSIYKAGQDVAQYLKFDKEDWELESNKNWFSQITALTGEDLDAAWLQFQQIVKEFNDQLETGEKDFGKYLKNRLDSDKEALKNVEQNVIDLYKDMAIDELNTYDYSKLVVGQGNIQTKTNLQSLLTQAIDPTKFKLNQKRFNEEYAKLITGDLKSWNEYIDEVNQNTGSNIAHADQEKVGRAQFEAYYAAYQKIAGDKSPLWTALDEDTQKLLTEAAGISQEDYTSAPEAAVEKLWQAILTLISNGVASINEVTDTIASRADKIYSGTEKEKSYQLLDKYKDGLTSDELMKLQEGKGNLFLDNNGKLTDEAAQYLIYDNGKFIAKAGQDAASVLQFLANTLGFAISKNTDEYKETIHSAVAEEINKADKADIGKQRVTNWQSIMSANVGDRLDISEFDDTTKYQLQRAGLIAKDVDAATVNWIQIQSEQSLNNAIDWMKQWLQSDTNIKSSPQTARYFSSMVRDLEEKTAKNAAFEGVVGETISQSAANALSMALQNTTEYADVQRLMQDMGFKWDQAAQIWKASAESIKAARLKIQQSWDANEIDNETYLNLMASLDETANAINPKTKQDNVILDMLQNYTNASEAMRAAFINNFYQYGAAATDIFKANDNGTYDIDVAELKSFLDSIGFEYDEAAMAQIEAITDSYLSNISTAQNYAISGASSLADIETFKQSYADIVGETLDENAFGYNTALQSFVLDPSVMNKYVDKQKELLLNMGYTEEFVNAYIEDQTESIIQASIELDGFLNANTSKQKNDEANKLITSIRNLSNYKDLLKGLDTKTASQYFRQDDWSDYINRDIPLITKQYDLAILSILESGGQAAVDLLKQIKPDASQEELEAVFNSQINKLNDVMSQVGDLVAGQFVGTEGKLYEVLRRAGAVDGNGVVQAGFSMVDVYAAIYAEMTKTVGVTTAGLNDAYAKLLTAQDQTNIDITEALKNGNGMSYADFGNLLAKYDIKFKDYMTEHWDTIIRDGFGNIRITDWEGFAKNVFKTDNLDAIRNTDEYISAFKVYNDGLIQLDKQAKENIESEINQITSMKPGDKLNLTEFWSRNKQAFENINEILRPFDAVFENGILSLGQNANLLGIASTIETTAQKAGMELGDGLEKVKDAVLAVLQSYTEAITKSIEGGLNNIEAADLIKKADNLGVSNLHFQQTADGLKLSQQSAIELYQALSKVDSLQGQIVFDKLSNSLKETNEHFSTTSALLNHIKDLTIQINSADEKISSARLEQYKAELEIAKEIVAVRSAAEDNSFNFMDNKIPAGQNNPLNYAKNWTKALKAIKDAYKVKNSYDLNAGGVKRTRTGYMGYEDFYNIVNEINNMAGIMKQPIQIGKTIEGDAITLDGSLTSASDAIMHGIDTLTAVDTGDMMVNIGALGINLAKGGKEFENNIDAGIDAVADAQIRALDGLIAMLELIVQMEELGDIAGEDMTIELPDIGIDKDSDGKLDALDEDFENWRDKFLELGSKSRELAESITINGQNMVDWLSRAAADWTEDDAAILNALYQAAISTDWNLDDIGGSLQQMLNSGNFSELTEGFTIEVGDVTYTISHGVVVEVADWSTDQAKDVLKTYKEKTGQKDDTKARQEIAGLIEKYLNGEGDTPELPITEIIKLRHQTLIQTDKKGNYIEVTGPDGKPIRYDEGSSGFKAAIEGQILKDQEGINAKDVSIDYEGGTATATATYGIKNKTNFVVTTDDHGNVEWKLNKNDPLYKYGKNTTGNTQAEILQNIYSRLKDYAAHGDQEAAKLLGDSTSFESFAYAHYGIHVKVQTEVYQDGEQISDPAHDPKFRNDAKALIQEIKEKGVEAVENIVSDNKGKTTITTTNGYTIQLDTSDISYDGKNIDQGLLTQKLEEIMGLDETLKDTITEAITEAFKALPEALKTLTDTDTTKLDTIANSLQTIGDKAFSAVSPVVQLGEAIANVLSLFGTKVEFPKIPPVPTEKKDKENNEGNQGESTEGDAAGARQTVDIIGNITDVIVGATDLTVDVKGAISKIDSSGLGENNTIDVKAKVETESLTAPEGLTVNYSAEVADKPSNIDGLTATWTGDIEGKVPVDLPNLKAHYTVDHSGTIPPSHIEGTVHYSISTDGTSPAIGTFGLNDGTMATLGKANATGTLMGELGPELVVSNGRYSVVGTNGPEMVSLPKDAIVFNHLQTESLLKKGMSKERGRAVTNERNAVAFATGNINGGPAMASASAALAALKQLRAMWESLKSAKVSDLAGAGGGGGGGGGGSNAGKIVDPKAWVKTVERWYNLTQEIAKLERQITHEETLRNKLQSDWQKNGRAYFKSQKLSLEALKQQITAQEQLNISRRDYYNKRLEALRKEPLGQLYTFDEEGQMKFRDDVQLNGKDGSMLFLTDLMGFDENGKANYTNKEKYEILMANGFEDYMKYNANGEQIIKDTDHDGTVSNEELEAFYEAATTAWRDRVDQFAEETQSLWDSIVEGENELIEKQTAMNEIWEEMRDNQMELENEVLEAIEDMKQREIDALQNERDALEESVGKYIDGLTQALDKEREMYEDQEAQAELNRNRRRLGILQRSGASAADISSLQSEINDQERDLYFDSQQRQIDAIQEASDKQIERLDNQIDLMTQQLEYQKEFGLLWGDVYQVMESSAQQITDFIMNGNSNFWKESPLGSADKFNSVMFQAEQWKEYEKNIDTITGWATMNSTQAKAEAFNTYDAAMKAEYGENYDPEGKYKEAFEQEYNSSWDITKATEAARKLYEADEHNRKLEERKAEAGDKWVGTDQYSYEWIDINKHWKYTYTKEVYNGVEGWYYESKKKEDHTGSGTICDKCGGKKKKKSSGGGSGGSNSGSGCASGCTGACKGICTSSCTAACKMGSSSSSSSGGDSMNKVGGKASGGFASHGIYELGEQGTEGVLTAEQTQVLRNNILSNRPSSLISLLKTYNEGFSRMDSPLTGTTTEDNSVTIENASVNMNVQQISNDYDARRAGEQAMNEIMRIARKTSAANSIRR